MAYPVRRVSVSCPNCQRPAEVTLQQVIDVGEEPALRDRLLRGRLNMLDCPHCGTKATMAAPLVYHDPDKSLFLAFLPNTLNMTMAQEEQEIGRLSNLVLDHTPLDKRRAYLITPTRVMSMDALFEKIFEAEGIDVEELRAQQKQLELISQLAEFLDSPEKFSTFVEENKERVDKQLMTLIAAYIAQLESQQERDTAERLRQVQKKLVEQLNLGKDDLPDLSPAAMYDSLIDALRQADDEQFQALVGANRPHLDYSFFMHLTQRADAATGEEKQALLLLRNRVLDTSDALDREAKQAMQHAADQLGQLLRAEDPRAALQGMVQDLDQTFMMVLAANIEQAQQEGREDVVAVLNTLQTQVIEMLESQMGPEMRTVRDLLGTEPGKPRQQRLQAAVDEFGATLMIETLEQMALELERVGSAPPEVIDTLYRLADDARDLATGSDDVPAPQAATSKIVMPGQSESDDDRPSIILPK